MAVDFEDRFSHIVVDGEVFVRGGHRKGCIRHPYTGIFAVLFKYAFVVNVGRVSQNIYEVGDRSSVIVESGDEFVRFFVSENRIRRCGFAVPRLGVEVVRPCVAVGDFGDIDVGYILFDVDRAVSVQVEHIETERRGDFGCTEFCDTFVDGFRIDDVSDRNVAGEIVKIFVVSENVVAGKHHSATVEGERTAGQTFNHSVGHDIVVAEIIFDEGGVGEVETFVVVVVCKKHFAVGFFEDEGGATFGFAVKFGEKHQKVGFSRNFRPVRSAVDFLKQVRERCGKFVFDFRDEGRINGCRFVERRDPLF